MRKLVLASLVVLGGCATTFQGSPYVGGGRGGCEQKCRAAGMEVSGMVFMGEYSNACVCQIPNARNVSSLDGATAAAAGASDAVMIQAATQQQQQNNSRRH